MPKDNDLRTASGVPPAPKLTFPTQYGQQAQPKTTKPQWKPVKKPEVPDYDPITGRLPQAIHNFVLDMEDFRNHGRDDRQRLLEGSTVRLSVNNQPVATVPLRLLLAASQVARTQYLSPPQEPLENLHINSPHPGIYSAALKHIVDWMKDTCTKQKAYYMSPSNFIKDVQLIAVATAIGMDTYVNHILKRHYAALKNDKLELSHLSTVENVAPDPNFPLFTCLVDRLSNELVRGERSTEVPEFQQWMAQCPKISNFLKIKYDQQRPEYLNKVQASEDRKKAAEQKLILKETGEMSRRLLQEQHANAAAQKQKDRETREQAKAAEEARKQNKMKQKEDLARRLNSGGRVNTVTAEEAKLLRRGSGA